MLARNRIFNLSYDNSEKLARPGQNNRIERRDLLKFLLVNHVINYKKCFKVSQKGVTNDTPTIIYAVKTTLIFHSTLTREQIVGVLSTWRDKIFYVLTEVKEDEEQYLGTMHADEDLHADSNIELWDLIENDEDVKQQNNNSK